MSSAVFSDVGKPNSSEGKNRLQMDGQIDVQLNGLDIQIDGYIVMYECRERWIERWIGRKMNNLIEKLINGIIDGQI